MRDDSVYIRLVEESDISRICAWVNDYEIGEALGYLPITLAQERRWFETTIGSNTKFVFAICLAQTDEHVGNVGLGNISQRDRNAMLSVFIGEECHRGKGYGTQAVRLVLDFAFNRLDLRRVYLKVSDYNQAACRFYESLGFRHEGVWRQHEFRKGRYVDKHLYGLLKDEYVLTPVEESC